ncbi:MAG: hypothetical protein D6790_18545, partial [Caldilineae bacterium]
MLDQTIFIVLAAAVSAGGAVFLFTRRLHLRLGPAPARVLARYLDAAQPEDSPSPSVSRERVILASLGLPPREGLLPALKLSAGLLPGLALLLLGFPPVPAVGAGSLAAMLVHAGLEGRWRRFQMGIEAELPTFVSRLAATLLVTSSPLRALEEVTATLAEDSPLGAWMERLLAGLRTQGQSHLAQAREEAALLSPSLALVVFELGRFFETGGSGFARAFGATADQLAAILEARAVAGSKAESARSAVHTMLAIMGVILLLMLSSPVQRQGFAHPTAQLVTAASLAAMAYGY